MNDDVERHVEIASTVAGSNEPGYRDTQIRTVNARARDSEYYWRLLFNPNK